jgi:hypothetical protein
MENKMIFLIKERYSTVFIQISDLKPEQSIAEESRSLLNHNSEISALYMTSSRGIR